MTSIPVSVVIPFYNGHSTIRRTIASVERQTVPPGEIVLVDDGSWEPFHAEQFNSTIPIRVVRHDSNLGIPAARNTGIRACTCQWIAFLDHDDEWTPEKLERQWQVISTARNPTELVVYDRCLWLDVAEGKAEKFPTARSMRTIGRDHIAAVKELLSHGNVIPFITLLVHRQIFERHGYLDEQLVGGSDDYEFVLRLLAAGVRFECSAVQDQDRYVAIHHVTGRNYSNGPGLLADDAAVFSALAARHPALASHTRKALARAHFRTGRFYERVHERRSALEHYRSALARDGLSVKTWLALLSLPVPRPIKRALESAWVRARSLRGA